MDFDTVCRICLNKDNLCCIFDSDCNDVSVPEKLNECGCLRVINLFIHSILI